MRNNKTVETIEKYEPNLKMYVCSHCQKLIFGGYYMSNEGIFCNSVCGTRFEEEKIDAINILKMEW